MRKSILAASIAALATPAAFAGDVTTAADFNLNINGGMTAGYFSTNNNAGSGNEDTSYQVSDFLIELSGEASKAVSFVGAFGSMSGVSVVEGNIDAPGYPYGFQYGWLSVAPTKGLSIDAGLLATNVGYEIPPTYANANITRSAVWYNEPDYYPGVRLSYDMGGMGVYVEANSDSLGTATAAWAAGINGSAASVDYAVSYFKYNGYKDLIDVILSGEVAGMTVAANLDYHQLKNAPSAGADDNALGLALYVTPSVGDFDVPLRVEYLSDGNSGIFGVDSGYTFTITPTYHYTDNTFVRAELSYVATDNKIFMDKDGGLQDNKTSFAVQAGFIF